MSNPRIPSKGEDLRALLERELEERRGRAPEPGEIFVLSETAELPVEWALLEAGPNSFLAIPADTQPLAGSRDFALGANVLSGPLVLRCGHAAEIAASRLRPELRTGLLDPHSLAAARSLQKALAAGTSAADPVGEEVDRDPEYRDWVTEVLDPARAVLRGLGEGDNRSSEVESKVVPFEDRRLKRVEQPTRVQAPGWRPALPWLVAAGLAIALGWSNHELREIQVAAAEPQFDEPSLALPGGTVRGETSFPLPPDSGSPGERVHISGFTPSDLVGPTPTVLVLLDKFDHEVVRSPVRDRGPSDDWSMAIPRLKVSPGRYRVALRSLDGKPLAVWDIRVVESADAS
ncbi:MAG: hypothetical protein ABJC13_14760 [Acidobacteriota bacterium]